MRKTALVTGATGFVGSHLCKRLSDMDWHVVAVGVNHERQPHCSKLLTCSLEQIPLESLPQVDVCFHQAANNDTTLQNYSAFCDSNLLLPSRMFKRLAKSGCAKFIYASSCSIYGCGPTPFRESQEPMPLNPYARSKMLFEKFAVSFANEFAVQVVGLRYTNVYGFGETHKGKRASMIHQILSRVLDDREVVLFKNGEQKRDWVYVDDVVDANIQSLEARLSAVLNVGSGEITDFNQIVKHAGLATGKTPKISYISCPFEQQYQSKTEVDLALAEKLIGYQPKWNVADGIQTLAQKMKERML